MKVLVTGATGYIGGRLVSLLLDNGYSVSVLTRDLEQIRGQDWEHRIDKAIECDLLEESGSWAESLKDFDVAYYLVHSLYAGKDFHELDKKCAENFGEAAQGIKHVIYLGGLIPEV